MFKVKDLDIDTISSEHENSFLSKLPFISNLVDSAERFIARYQKISVQIEKIVEELDKSKMELLKDVKYNDLIQAVHRFEKKVHDLKLSRMVSLQTAPQIRLIQNNNQILIGFDGTKAAEENSNSNKDDMKMNENERDEDVREGINPLSHVLTISYQLRFELSK